MASFKPDMPPMVLSTAKPPMVRFATAFGPAGSRAAIMFPAQPLVPPPAAPPMRIQPSSAIANVAPVYNAPHEGMSPPPAASQTSADIRQALSKNGSGVNQAIVASQPPLPIDVRRLSATLPTRVMPSVPPIASSTACAEPVGPQRPNIAPTTGVRERPPGPLEVPCRGTIVPQSAMPVYFRRQNRGLVTTLQGMGGSLSELGGEWEDWCTVADRVWREVRGSDAKADEYAKKCVSQPFSFATLAPQTAVGKLQRGLPVEYSSDANIVRGGVAAALKSALPQSLPGLPGGSAPAPRSAEVSMTTSQTPGQQPSGQSYSYSQQPSYAAPAASSLVDTLTSKPVLIGAGVLSLGAAFYFLKKGKGAAMAGLMGLKRKSRKSRKGRKSRR